MRPHRTLLAACVVAAALASPASAWVVHDAGVPGSYFALALAPNGDPFVVAGGTFTVGPSLVRLKAATGEEAYRRQIDVVPTGGGAATVLVRRGNVVFYGGDLRPGGSIRGALLAFDATTGDELWRHTFAGGGMLSLNQVHGLAVDGAGNVIGAGEVYEDDESTVFYVVKVDGDTGLEQWSYRLNGEPMLADAAIAVAVDGAGHVTATGYSQDAGGPFRFAIVQLDGATGTERWKRTDVVGQGYAIALDASGNVVVGGTIGDGFTGTAGIVMKLDRNTGADVWTHPLGPLTGTGDAVVSLALTADGDVLAAGQRDFASIYADTRVVRVDGGTGAEEWHADLPLLLPWQLALGPGGTVAIAGRLFRDFTVLTLDAANGTQRSLVDLGFPGGEGYDDAQRVAVDASGAVVAAGYGEFGNVFEPVLVRFSEAVAGTRLTMRDLAGKAPTLRVVADDDGILPSVQSGAGDPTAAGGKLLVANPVSGEQTIVDLPASGWRALRTRTPGSTRYTFRGNGSCNVRVQPGRWKASCKGLGFTLDEPAQDRLLVRLEMTNGPRWCTAFGGVIAADVPGRFDARGALAPSGCD